jgi:hypothetical protein
MIRIPYSTQYQVNKERTNADGANKSGEQQAPCVVCGRGIATSRQRFMVHVVDGGLSLALPEDETTDPRDDLGLYPIGPDCRRKHPELKPYIVSIDQ